MIDPRPHTDYLAEFVCCPECGAVRPDGKTESWCVPCANIGHSYRLMGEAELLWTVTRLLRDGYDDKARMRMRVAERLRVYKTIRKSEENCKTALKILNDIMGESGCGVVGLVVEPRRK